MSIKFQNHLIEEQFIQVKPEEIKCIKFQENHEHPTVKITPMDNMGKTYEFIIDSYNENLYKNQTLLLLRCPTQMVIEGIPRKFQNNFIKFLKEWFYSNKKFSLTLTNLEYDLEFNFFEKPVSISKENFFFEGVFNEEYIIFRILLSHSLLR